MKINWNYIKGFFLITLVGFLYGFANHKNNQVKVKEIKVSFEKGNNLFMNFEMETSAIYGLARMLGLSDAVIGLTIVAIGTGMPELATSVVAAIRKQPDIAIGNIVGSNIFNILGILGVTALIKPISSAEITWIDTLVMIILSLLLLPFIKSGFTLRRWEGALLLLIYLGYMVFLLY